MLKLKLMCGFALMLMGMTQVLVALFNESLFKDMPLFMSLDQDAPWYVRPLVIYFYLMIGLIMVGVGLLLIESRISKEK